MTKVKFWMLAMVACVVLVSCTDTISTSDNPVAPEQQPSAADELASEKFIHEEWMDRSVKPGDSFWQFSIGKWLKDGGGLGPMLSLYFSGLQILTDGINDYHGSNHTLQLIKGPKPSVEEQTAVIKDVLAQLNLNSDASKADVMRNIGKLADLGFCAILGHDIVPVDGVLRYDIIPGIVSSSTMLNLPKEIIISLVKECCEQDLGLDLSKPENVKLAEEIVEIDCWFGHFRDKWRNSDPVPSIMGRGRTALASDPVPARTLLTRAKTRANDDLMDAFGEAFHIDNDTYCQPELTQMFEFINQFDVQTLQLYLQFYVVSQLNTAVIKPESATNVFYTSISSLSKSIFLDYEKEMLMKGRDCEGALEMLEEIRTQFAHRIQNATWLSEATKDKALKKLKAMGFIVGAPEKLFNADFELTGKTPIEDLIQYRGLCDNYLRGVLPGKRAAEYQWEYILVSPMGVGIGEPNAFYDRASNQLCILPAFLGGDIFPIDKNNVNRYATGWVFSHEMTHGFDGNGAQYDLEGKKVNWWAPEDEAKFKQLQQMMVERYNELEQVPGVPANGEKTKNENIADIGGFNLAYDVWSNKLKADGLTGEQLRYLQRQFFLAASHLWQISVSESVLLTQLETDLHSANHNRMNGTVRLVDDWYDLFGVEPGDKLYVKPADRVKIW